MSLEEREVKARFMVAVVTLLLLVVLANVHDEEGEKNWIIIPFFFQGQRYNFTIPIKSNSHL